MAVLSELNPKEVFRYFEELCLIPHGSGDTKRISDYCADFAKEHGLRYIQDKDNNIIIFKGGTKGYENAKPVILQGHLDMVCEKDSECDINFATEGLRLGVKDGYVYAEGTTLGGDDGIAIAYALAILSSDSIAHPPIEAVFTVDEEIGMLGAASIDCSSLKADTMLNIDSEEEGYLLVSCAGGVTATCHIPVVFDLKCRDLGRKALEQKDSEQKDSEQKVLENNALEDKNLKYKTARVIVDGLKGGHSGTEIDKGRANANQVLGRVLYAIKKYVTFNIIDIFGGLKDNAIPRQACAEILIHPDEAANIEQAEARLCEIIDEYNQILKNEYRLTDGDINVSLELDSVSECCGGGFIAFDDKTTERVITALVNLPCGISKMSHDIEGLVQTSLNLGILKTIRDNKMNNVDNAENVDDSGENSGITGDGEKNEVILSYSVRSSVKSEKDELVGRLECLMQALSGYVTCVGEYPAWEYKNDSRLREIMIEVYEEQYGVKPVIQAIHAGVECGLFAGKIEGLDCVSFGPDILDIHTPKERLDIKSVERVWKYIIGVLNRLR